MDLATTPNWAREGVSLFLLEESHVNEAYSSWLNDPRINRYLESRFTTHTAASTRDFVRGCRDSPTTLMLGIRSQSLGNRHVGNIKIGPIDRHHGLGEVGILIGEPDAWGRGIGRTAIVIVSDIARDQLGLRKLTAGCYAGNVGSQRAFLGAGFDIEGRRRDHFLLDGQTEDLVLMARWLSVPPGLSLGH
jgi:ribosomal-protein-alanine N-acetyltransferase